MPVSLPILVALRCIIYCWKWIDKHFPTQVQLLADKAFTATDGLISQLFVVAFVYSTYVRIVFIWGFSVQLSL